MVFAFLFHRSKVVDLVGILLLLSPESQILLEEFNDGLGIAEVALLELVNLVEGVLEGLVGKVAGSLVVLHDLVVEDGEVEGEAELDGVAGGKGDLVGGVVGLEGVGFGGIEVGTLGVLGNVTIVVADHLDEEGLWLTVAGSLEYVGVDHVHDALAVVAELSFDAGLVLGKGIGEFGVLGVLLNCGNGAAGGALGADEVLEGNGEEVALVGGDIGTLLLHDLLELVNHILKALSLFGHTGKENVFFYVRHPIFKIITITVNTLLTLFKFT